MGWMDDGMLNMGDLELIKSNFILYKVPDGIDSRNFPLSEDRTPISFHKNTNSIVIYLEPVSTLPQPILKHKKDLLEPFVSFAERNAKVLNSIGFSQQSENHISFLRENLANRLILALPILKFNQNNVELGERYYFNYEMIYISEERPEAESYVTVPSVVTHIDRRRFESILEKKVSVQFIHYNGMMPCPEFIVCEDVLYHIPQDALIPNIKNINTFVPTNPTQIRKMWLPTDFKESSRCSWQGLYFIPSDHVSELRAIMESTGIPYSEELKTPQAKLNITNLTPAQETIPGPQTEAGQLTEYEFLQALKNCVNNSSLYYEERDLYNFHTAVKTNFLTILGGMSGTGKTQLALAYAEALGLKRGKDLLFIPISPSYTEPSDLLGYLNPLTGAYIESESGLARFLYKASQEPKRLHMVIFDEMNLSQVEYWFSPFISLLELNFKDRELRLVSERQYCLNEEYRTPFKIGENVILVGTANFDETTKEFSNRLLDRANVIYLTKQSFLNAKNVNEEPICVPEYGRILSDTFRSWTKVNVHLNLLQEMNDKELTLLDEIHSELSKIDTQNGVSFRVCKAIANYISNMPCDEDGKPLIARRSAFDLQLRQRVFTKIKGHKEMLIELMGEYNIDTDKVDNSKIMQLLEGYDDDKEKVFENFEQSVNFLKQKAKELVIHGYTM